MRYTGLGSQTTTRSLWIDSVNSSGVSGGTFDIANVGGSLTWNPGSGQIINNVTKTGAGTFTLGGVISSNAALAVNGGTMNLRGVNTSTGAVMVSGGTLNVTGTGQLFSTINAYKANAITIQDGGELQIDNWNWTGSLGTLNYESNALVLNGGTLTYQGTTAYGTANRGFTVGTNGATFNAASAGQTWVLGRASGTPTYLSAFNGSSTLTGAGNGQMDQYITGSGGLTKNGSGTWTLTGANTYTGGTIVNAGTLGLTQWRGITNNLVINSGGTVSLGGQDNTLWSVTTNTINSGGLLTQNASNTTHLNAVVLNGGTITSQGSPTGSAITWGSYLLDGGVSTIGSSNTAVISAQNVALTQPGGTVFNVASGATNGIDLLFSGTIGAPTGNVGYMTSLVKSGNGVMQLTGKNTFTNATIVNGGTLAIANGGTLYSNWLIQTVTVTNGGILQVAAWGDAKVGTNGGGLLNDFVAGDLVLAGGTVRYAATNADSGYMDRGFTIGSGGATLDAAGGTNDWILSYSRANYSTIAANNNSLTLSGSNNGSLGLSFNGSGNLIKTGSGTWTITRTDSHSGTTLVNGGTLAVAYGGSLYSNWTTAPVTVTNGGVLQVAAWGDSKVGTSGGGLMNAFEATNLIVAGGTIRYAASQADAGSMDRGFTIGTGGATLEAAGGTNAWSLIANRGGAISTILANNNNLTLGGPNNGNLGLVYSGSGTLAKSGSGTWTLTGANTYTGGTIVSAGTLAVSNALANNGSSTITVNNGATLQFKVDNVFGVHTATALTPIVANAGGTVGIDSGRFDILGPLSLNGGALQSLGTNSFTGFALKGTVTVNGGTNGSSISGTGFTLGSAAVTGTTFNVANGGTVSGIDLTVSANVYDGAAPAWSPSTQASTLTKTGAGAMMITGNASYTGGTTISAGSLAFLGTNNLAGGNFRVGGAGGSSTLSFAGGSTTASTGSYLYAGTLSGDRAVVNAGANLSVGNVNLGTVSGASGALNVSGGTVSQTGGPAWWAFMVGATNGGYGSLRMTGGALNLSEIGIGSVLGGTGAVDLLGGTMTVSNWFTMNRADANNPANVAALNIFGGTLNASSAGNGLGWGAGGYGVVNIGTGGLANFGTNALRLALVGAANLTNIVSLGSGGVLQAAGVTMNGFSAGGTAILNFNGGTLRNGVNVNSQSTVNGLTAVYVGAGGGVIDNGGSGKTLVIDQNLLAPTGSGLSSITLSNGGSGYIGAPVVQITGGGGSGASAIAQIDTSTGTITNILVTAAGSGYTSAPTITLVGGGAASVASGISVVTNAVTSGGLTFNGSGLTLLRGTNTFGGAIAVNDGVLQFITDTQLGKSNNSITLNGGALYNYSSDPLIASTRTINLTSNGGYLQVGWSSTMNVAGTVTGSGPLGIGWNSGTVTLSGSNSYTGTTTIGTTNANAWWNNSAANPTLKLGNSNALTGGGALVFGTSSANNTATLDLNGFSASVGGLSGASNARITNTSSGAATLTLAPSNSSSTYAGTIANGSGAIALVKNGAGTQTLTANTTDVTSRI